MDLREKIGGAISHMQPMEVVAFCEGFALGVQFTVAGKRLPTPRLDIVKPLPVQDQWHYTRHKRVPGLYDEVRRVMATGGKMSVREIVESLGSDQKLPYHVMLNRVTVRMNKWHKQGTVERSRSQHGRVLYWAIKSAA